MAPVTDAIRRGSAVTSSPVPVKRVLTGHIDPDFDEFPVTGGKEIAVRFIDQTAIMKRVGDPKPHSDVRPVAGIDKMKAVMSDGGVMRPQPVEHAANLVMAVKFHAMCFNSKDTARVQSAEKDVDILIIDALEIADDQ